MCVWIGHVEFKRQPNNTKPNQAPSEMILRHSCSDPPNECCAINWSTMQLLGRAMLPMQFHFYFVHTHVAFGSVCLVRLHLAELPCATSMWNIAYKLYRQQPNDGEHFLSRAHALTLFSIRCDVSEGVQATDRHCSIVCLFPVRIAQRLTAPCDSV